MKQSNSLLAVVLILSCMVCCAQDARAATIAWWRFQDALSGKALPVTNEVASTPDRDLDADSGWTSYRTASLPIAPNGTSVPGNTAYTEYVGGQGLFDTGPGFLNSNTYTWEGFYRRANDAVSANFYGNDTSAYHSNGISRVGVDAGGDVILQLSGNDVGNTGNTTEEFTFAGADDAQWHHFAFTWDNGTLTGYVDYQIAGTHTPTAYTSGRIFNDFAYLTVGFANETTGSLGAFWSGDLDEIRISDEVLDSSEFLGAIPEPCSGLLFGLGFAGLACGRRRR